MTDSCNGSTHSVLNNLIYCLAINSVRNQPDGMDMTKKCYQEDDRFSALVLFMTRKKRFSTGECSTSFIKCEGHSGLSLSGLRVTC